MLLLAMLHGEQQGCIMNCLSNGQRCRCRGHAWLARTLRDSLWGCIA